MCPIAQPPKGDRAPRLKLARGMAAKAIPHPVLDLAEGLPHEVQRVLLSQHHQPSRGRHPRVAAVWSAHPTGPVPGGRPPDSWMAWVKTWVTPGRRVTPASERSRSCRVFMTGETRCPLDKTVKTISLARDRRVAERACRLGSGPKSCARRRARLSATWWRVRCCAGPHWGGAAHSSP